MRHQFVFSSLLACAVAGTLALPGRASANIVSNGGFETGDFTGWTGTAVSDPFSGVSCPGMGSAPEGSCEAFFGTLGALGTLTQTLSTVAGKNYVVNFSFTPDGSVPSSFSVSFGGQLLYSVMDPASASPQTFKFFAPAFGSSTALTFSFMNDPGFFYLDAVSAEIPEPESLALAAIGLIVLAGRPRRRARGQQA